MSQVKPVNPENGLHRPDESQQTLQTSLPELVELHAFMQSVSSSITNLEISMASQSSTMQDLQKTLTSQSSSILHLQASLDALPIGANSSKSEKVNGKSLSVLSCPNPELSSQRSPQSSSILATLVAVPGIAEVFSSLLAKSLATILVHWKDWKRLQMLQDAIDAMRTWS